MRFAVGEAYDGALLRSFLKKEVGISTALLSRLKAYTQEMKEEVEAKDAKLKEVGYKNYTK